MQELKIRSIYLEINNFMLLQCKNVLLNSIYVECIILYKLQKNDTSVRICRNTQSCTKYYDISEETFNIFHKIKKSQVNAKGKCFQIFSVHFLILLIFFHFLILMPYLFLHFSLLVNLPVKQQLERNKEKSNRQCFEKMGLVIILEEETSFQFHCFF